MAQRENHGQHHRCQRLIIHLMVEGYSELKVKSGKKANRGQDVDLIESKKYIYAICLTCSAFSQNPLGVLGQEFELVI